MTTLEITTEIVSGFLLFLGIWIASISGQAWIEGFRAVADPRDHDDLGR